MPTRTSTSKKTVKRVTKKRAPAKRHSARVLMTEPVVMETIHEVVPVVSESHVSMVVSRLSFYLGVVTGAAVLHVLIFALVSIVNS